MFTRSSGVAPAGIVNQCRPQETNKNRDYVYLALSTDQGTRSEYAPDLFGCSISPVNCLERSRNREEDRNPYDRHGRILLLISGIMNICLLISIIAVTVIHLQSFAPGRFIFDYPECIIIRLSAQLSVNGIQFSNFTLWEYFPRKNLSHLFTRSNPLQLLKIPEKRIQVKRIRMPDEIGQLYPVKMVSFSILLTGFSNRVMTHIHQSNGHAMWVGKVA